MGNTLTSDELSILHVDDLGPDNLGSFGPKTTEEAAAVHNICKPEYIQPPTLETRCMDDRLEVPSVQLPGSLLTTEVAADYMDGSSGIRPLSEMIKLKTAAILRRGRPVIIHQDCAAIKLQRTALAYIGANESNLLPRAWQRLRLMELTDHLTRDDLRSAAQLAGERVARDDLWDIDPEAVLAAAASRGAEVESFEGEHKAAGSRTDLSGQIFDNGAFRRDHKSADGAPLGMLSITLGAYANQLREDGFGEPEVARKVMQATLFTLGLQKLAMSETARDHLVG